MKKILPTGLRICLTTATSCAALVIAVFTGVILCADGVGRATPYFTAALVIVVALALIFKIWGKLGVKFIRVFLLCMSAISMLGIIIDMSIEPK